MKTYGKLHKYFLQMSAQEAVIKLLLERVYQISLIGQLHFSSPKGDVLFGNLRSVIFTFVGRKPNDVLPTAHCGMPDVNSWNNI